jgi:outer membrane lipoprotein-sorting protein
MRRILSVLIAFSLFLAWAGTVLPGEDDGGRAIVAKAIQAAGGEKNLAKLQSATWTETGTYYGMGDGLPYTGKYAASRPNKFRMEIEGVFTTVLNGEAGWIQAGGETKKMTKEQFALEQYNHKAGWIITLVPLKDKAFDIKSVPAAKKDGEMVVVQVTRKDYPTVKLYFSAKTNLLVKSEYRTKAADLEFKEVVMEFSYSKYQDVDGGKVPHKLVVKRDGKQFVEAEVSELKAAKFDAKAFAQPAD